jgi:hypothetical protein
MKFTQSIYDPGKEILFFDYEELETLERIKLSVCTAEKHPLNPVMCAGSPGQWDSAQASPWPMRTVLYDEEDQQFKCWYAGTDPSADSRWHTGYAFSHDGISWVKPELGLIEFNGNKKNNIIHPSPYGSVIKDKAEPDPKKRYKMHVRDWVRYSPDGIHWPDDETAKKTASVTLDWSGPKAWDVVAFLRDDQDPDPERRYKFVFQYYDQATKPGPEQVRFKGMVCGPNAINLKPASSRPLLSPNDGFEHENHFLMYIPYKGHWLLLYECGWYQPDGTGKFGRYLADIRLAHSRDGIHFARVNPEQSVIALGIPGEWDEQFLVISDKAIIKDGKISLYYCGQGRDWPCWPPKNAEENVKHISGRTSRSQMGLAQLRLDGFTCLETSDGVSFGRATTKLLDAGSQTPTEMTVNVSQTRPGCDWLQVEVLDAEGNPVPGYSRDDASPIATDGLEAVVRWNGKGLSSLPARPFRLRFHLHGRARLHAIKFPAGKA